MRNLFLAVAAVAGLASPVLATTEVNNAGDLNANDYYDWSQIGGVVSTPYGVTSNGGASATLSSDGGSLSRLTQGSSWAGNFTFGEAVLFTNFVGPDITISFADPVKGVGTQWQSNVFGEFGAAIFVYDAADVLIGTAGRGGNSTAAGDGSAIFLGVLSDSANIAKVRLSLSFAGSRVGEFSINRLLIAGTPGGIPEPATWAMLIAGFGLVGVAARRRSAATA